MLYLYKKPLSPAKSYRKFISRNVTFIALFPLAINPIHAKVYEGFKCEIGIEIIMETPTAQAGRGSVEALVDNNPWSVWGANYPTSATATFQFDTPTTVSQLGLFNNVFLPASGLVDVNFLKVDGSSEEVLINLESSGTQNIWHNKVNLNIPNVIGMEFFRDNTTENVAEIKLCSGQTSYFSVDNTQTIEGNIIEFMVSGSGNFSYSFDYETGVTDDDFIASGNDPLSGNKTAPTTITLQTNDDDVVEGTEIFTLNLSVDGVLISSAQGTITDNDVNGSDCVFSPDTNFQQCLPWDINTGVEVKTNQIIYKNWRLLAAHKNPKTDTLTTEDIASYGHEYHSNNINCFERHDKYWTLGDDGYAYHTWHPADDGVCTYQHEHGDNPNPNNKELDSLGDQYLDTVTNQKRVSEAFKYAKGLYNSSYPAFGYAMMVYNRTHDLIPNDLSDKYGHRREDHFGHKVIIANSIRLAIGEPQQMNSNIYDTGIRCDWYSKIHQGSYSIDALTNNMHEYFLNIVCNDGQPIQGKQDPVRYPDIQASRLDVTKISFKTMLNWGDPYLIKEKGDGSFWEAYVPFQNPSAQPEFITVWDAVTSEAPNTLYTKYNPIKSMLNTIWGDAEPIAALDTKPTIINGINVDFNESGSRDFETFGSIAWKAHWDSWHNNGDSADQSSGIEFPELWSGPSGNRFEIPNGVSLNFAPYYIVKNPARMLSVNSNSNLVIERTVNLCQGGNYNVFCSGVDANSNWKKSEFFNGTVRALNFKAVGLMNSGGDTDWCTDAIGEITTCGDSQKQIRQKASTIDNGWQQWYGASERKVCDKNGVLHCGEPIVGTIERWSIDYQNGKWITNRKNLNQDPAKTDYKGAGMGFEWIMNHGNNRGVHVPN